MRIFVAGATGVIGIRLVPLLVARGHTVAGMTRSAERAGLLSDLGAEPVVCDVFDADAVGRALATFQPDVVIHQLTDLPADARDIIVLADRNNRMRTEGTRNLLAAAAAAGAQRVIAQSVSWEMPGDRGRSAAELERAVLDAGGVVVRYGQFFGPGTYYEASPPDPPRVHVGDAARQTLLALDAPPGLTIVVDDRSSRAATA